MKPFGYGGRRTGFMSQPTGNNFRPGGHRSAEPNDIKTPDFLRRHTRNRFYQTPEKRKSTGTPDPVKA